MSNVKVNTAIYRIENDPDGTAVFVQFPVVDGVLAQYGRKFKVHEGDSYLSMNERQVVLAFFDPEKKSSVDVLWFTCLQDGEEVVARSVPYADVSEMVFKAVSSLTLNG